MPMPKNTFYEETTWCPLNRDDSNQGTRCLFLDRVYNRFMSVLMSVTLDIFDKRGTQMRQDTSLIATVKSLYFLNNFLAGNGQLKHYSNQAQFKTT